MCKTLVLTAMMLGGCTGASDSLSICQGGCDSASASLTVDGKAYALSDGAVQADSVQKGHFVGGTLSTPWVGIWLDAKGTLTGTHRCSPDGAGPFTSGTGVAFEVEGGSVFATGSVPTPQCEISVTEVASTTVSLSITGKATLDGRAPVDFAAVFRAEVLK